MPDRHRALATATSADRTTALAPCPLCGGERQALPPLGPPSVISDGRLDGRALTKASCLSCGSTSHVDGADRQNVRSSFDRWYDLGISFDPLAQARGSAYARVILDILSALEVPPPRSVLDVGCGLGSLLSAMIERLPELRAAGVEAASRLATAAAGRGLAVREGFAEDLPPPDDPYDLVCSLNVIEHTHDPSLFLRSLVRQVAPGGRIAIICPRADRPNLELVFRDHLFSLTRTALETLGRDVGLRLDIHCPVPDEDDDFQLCLFSIDQSDGVEPARGSLSPDLLEARRRYLAAWQTIDASLLAEAGEGPLACFGAGEVAALIRAYAPRTWAHVGELLADDPGTARRLDRPTNVYRPASGPCIILVAVHPSRQQMVARRVEADGYTPVCLPSTIHN